MSDISYYHVFHALQNPIRRKILLLLRRRPQSVLMITAGVATALRIGFPSRPAISQHLQVLVKAGLVSCTAEGNRNLYRLRRDGLELVRDYVEQLLKSPGLE
jgi:DNA-binding transcriptional ArsR family regulator